ncbi:MAG: type I restriction endonuclease subunit R [Micrococcales bacterium]|nr:type I restriction endonuclease subunit R [Micrococcales bacterium]
MVAENPGSTVLAQYTPVGRECESYQSEADLEAEFIATLCSQAYERVMITCEADLVTNLRAQLEALNGMVFSDGEWQRFFSSVIASETEGIVEKTRKIQQDHVQLLRRDDGSTKNIRLIDKSNIHNNRLQVVNQYETAAGLHENRYDVTILVNGLPLVHVELKRRGVAMREAFNQIDRYQRESFWSGAGLFEYVQIFVISNGTRTKYYANTTRDKHVSPNRRGRRAGDTYEFTMWWADASNLPITDLTDFARTFFARHTLLAILTRYCVFNSAQELMVMRPYQIVAAEAILNRIELAGNYEQMGTVAAGGYIWHTTGSGKTLTSFKTAQLAKELDLLDRVLFVVDRQDLDFKTMKDFEHFQQGAVSGSTSTRKLREALDTSDARIVVTTIQKLTRLIARYPDHPVYGEHVAIIFDECHRSLFGQMQQDITRVFKRYHLFGFTGTPIFATNAGPGGVPKSSARSGAKHKPRLRTTEQVFGERLHTYTIVDAIRDKTVLPFKMDYVKSGDEAEEVRDLDVSDIDRERALLDHKRVAGIVSYILEHFNQKTKRGHTYRLKDRHLNGFNSIFATASIPAVKAYYAEFARQQADLPLAQRLKVALIFSFAPNEATPDGLLPEEDFSPVTLDASSREFLDAAMAEYNQVFGTSFDTSGDSFAGYHKDVARRLEDREIDLLIVVNMFLTGFDAKTLNTLWVDKKLRHHGLIQAFSRTNRILNTVKAYGTIVCFRNLEPATNEALALFGDHEATGLVLLRPYDEYYAEYRAQVDELFDRFPVPASLDDERAFITLCGQLLRQRNILLSFDQFTEDQWLLTDRQWQDYLSAYNDLWTEWRLGQQGEKETINDDLVFEIELVKQVAMDLPAILALVQQHHEANTQDKQIPASISRAIDSSPSLRSKKDLIERFVATLAPDVDASLAWPDFVEAAKSRELDQIIADERLKADPAREFMANAFRDGGVPASGTAITRILPPTSRFAQSGQHATIKARVLDRLREFFSRFADL